MKRDIVIVGAGLSGCTLANLLAKDYSVLIIDRRNHIGGNCYDCYNEHGILIHKYGPHFFHTNNLAVWKYLSTFTKWTYYQHRVFSYINGQYLKFPLEANEQCYIEYEKKQWGEYYDKLDPSVRERTKKSSSNDDRYFNDKYQAIPKLGYTRMFENMLDNENINIMLNTEWLDIREDIEFKLLIWTGMMDEYYNFQFGPLPYISIRFEFETFNKQYLRSATQINYPYDYDFTRTTEIKHATGQNHPMTTILREYPECSVDAIPCYPIPCQETAQLYKQYFLKSSKLKNVLFVGRLAMYQYMNMDVVISTIFNKIKKWKSLIK